eukprot:TRINITY_DN5528_c0_g1_i1.p1 TRINITY_DN5528_c0_g1~~TRINITY_DN5528_c0_g1_i1.p1  ORF type:complete len:262 (-),score=138.43 TRINITY_DN5528_c0_g1_i1:62-847(-)
MARPLFTFLLVALLLVSTLFAFTTVSVSAQDEETVNLEQEQANQQQQQRQQEESSRKGSNQLHTSSDISIGYVFPDYESTRVIGGERVEVLMNIANTGNKGFKVAAVGASLRHPMDFRYVIQNFTSYEYSVVVPPHEEVTIGYHFKPWELEERDYFLLGDVYLIDSEDRQYYSTWANATITLTEPPAVVDGKMFLAILAVLGGLGYYGYLYWKNQSAEKAAAARSARFINHDDPTKSDEWLVGTHAVNKKKGKTVKAKKSN